MTEPLEPRAVAFYGDEIIAVQQHEGAIYVLFSRMCENLGRPRVTETRRAQQHAVLSTGLIELTIQTSGGPQSLLCLRLDLIPLWLAGIPSKRVKEAFKGKLVRYQTEAATVLWEAFKPQILIEERLATTESALAISQLEQIIEQSKAMQRMAEEQITLIRRMDTAARVVKAIQADVAEVKGDVAGVQIRLGEMEERLHPSAYITNEQAAEVQSAVAAVAMALTQRDPSKNHFQSIHAELHRRFKAKSYSLIRIEQYGAVLAFLEEWDRAMEGGDEGSGENA
jgi:hypothetical protein